MSALDRTLQRPGALLRFHDAGGEGLPVVLTHGAGMDHTSFLPQADALRGAGYRPILWDMRNHGQSEVEPGATFSADRAQDDLAALLDTCQLARAVLVGHSLGGNLSQEFTRRHPQRISGLIVIGSTWNSGPLTPLEKFGLRLAGPLLTLVPRSRLPRMMAQASAVHPDVVRDIERVFARMPKAVFRDVWSSTVSLVAPDPAYRTPVPLALIRGDQDRTGNISSAMPRWAEHEGIVENVIPDAGHVVMLDAPQATNEVLLSALGTMQR